MGSPPFIGTPMGASDPTAAGVAMIQWWNGYIYICTYMYVHIYMYTQKKYEAEMLKEQKEVASSRAELELLKKTMV